MPGEEISNRDILVAITRLTDSVARLQADFAAQREEIKRLEAKLEAQYTPLSRFSPVEKAVYSLIALIATTVVAAMLAQVVISP